MYRETLSGIQWDDVLEADVVFISLFMSNAHRGQEPAVCMRTRPAVILVFIRSLNSIPLSGRLCVQYMIRNDKAEDGRNGSETDKSGHPPLYPAVLSREQRVLCAGAAADPPAGGRKPAPVLAHPADHRPGGRCGCRIHAAAARADRRRLPDRHRAGFRLRVLRQAPVHSPGDRAIQGLCVPAAVQKEHCGFLRREHQPVHLGAEQ